MRNEQVLQVLMQTSEMQRGGRGVGTERGDDEHCLPGRAPLTGCVFGSPSVPGALASESARGCGGPPRQNTLKITYKAYNVIVDRKAATAVCGCASYGIKSVCVCVFARESGVRPIAGRIRMKSPWALAVRRGPRRARLLYLSARPGRARTPGVVPCTVVSQVGMRHFVRSRRSDVGDVARCSYAAPAAASAVCEV